MVTFTILRSDNQCGSALHKRYYLPFLFYTESNPFPWEITIGNLHICLSFQAKDSKAVFQRHVHVFVRPSSHRRLRLHYSKNTWKACQQRSNRRVERMDAGQWILPSWNPFLWRTLWIASMKTFNWRARNEYKRVSVWLMLKNNDIGKWKPKLKLQSKRRSMQYATPWYFFFAFPELILTPRWKRSCLV